MSERGKITYRRARRNYRCDAVGAVAECQGRINRGETYERWLAFPGHTYAGDWSVLRICLRCSPEAAVETERETMREKAKEDAA